MINNRSGMRSLLGCLLASSTLQQTKGVIIAKSTLNQCYQTDTGLTGCNNKLVVAVTVENGENATSSIQLNILSATVDGAEQQLANKQISVVLRKTPVYFYYPTTYYETFNYQPWEQLAYGSLSGTDFTPFNDNIFFGEINSCSDGDFDENPSCGWAYDGDDNKISSSQGKCCKCTAFQLAGFDNFYMTRSNLQCGLSSAYTQSSHCLRFDPLWYHTYSVGTATTFYAIQVETHYCDRAGLNCNVTAISLSPNSRTAKSNDNLVFAQLVGDLATFEAAPDFGSYYLAVPSGLSGADCNGLEDPSRDISLYSRCLDHINAGPDYYMFVPKSDFGSECNKIGVDYANFRFQSDFCTQQFGSCTQSQLADLFDSEQLAADSGASGRYWASNQGSLGLAQLTVENAAGVSMTGTMQQSIQPVSNADASLVFQTNRYQTSLLVLELAADDITYVVCLGTAAIISVSLPTFEANGDSGSLSVTLSSTSTAAPGSENDCNAAFLIQVTECSSGIVPAVTASSVDLSSGQSKTVSINIKYEATIGQENTNHNCTVAIYDAYANVVDSQRLDFETTATVTVRPQENDCTDSSSCGDAAAQSLIDPCLCQWYEFSCIMDDWEDCASTFWNFIIVVGCVLAVLVCCCVGCCALGPKGCIKCVFLPCRLIGRCIKNGQKENGEDGNARAEPSSGGKSRSGKASAERSINMSTFSAPSVATNRQGRPSDCTARGLNSPGQQASLIDNKMPSPVHATAAIVGGLHGAQQLCGVAYFNVSQGMDSSFVALVQPGPNFSLRGFLMQPVAQGNVFSFQVPTSCNTQYLYFDSATASYLKVAPPRRISDSDRQRLGGSMLDSDVLRFVTKTPKFTVLNESR
eukprot:INCI13174.1.p1 GENE.INCI13174.1~~INCI13174.1.p1  ORF type:complete len:863 (-),score=128.39 INCI13174.1:47-2635(-)